MTNTALRAENSNSRTITFKSKEHEKFYEEYLEKCRYQDVYHQALYWFRCSTSLVKEQESGFGSFHLTEE